MEKPTFFTLRLPKDGRPEKTFFFRRPDGSVFACNERLAAATVPRIPGRLQFLGESNGMTFFRKFHEAIAEQNKATEELGDMPATKAAAQKWIKKRKDIEARAKQAFLDAQAAELAQAKVGNLPNMDMELAEASNGVNVSNLRSYIKR